MLDLFMYKNQRWSYYTYNLYYYIYFVSNMCSVQACFKYIDYIISILY